MRLAMKTTVNYLLHVTGLFLITNTLNAALTGNYLFFNQTRSSDIVKNTSTDILKEESSPAFATAEGQEDFDSDVVLVEMPLQK